MSSLLTALAATHTVADAQDLPVAAAQVEQAAPGDARADGKSDVTPSDPGAAAGPPVRLEPLRIDGQASSPPWSSPASRRARLMPEVDGTHITVTRKNSVVRLDDQPEIIDNNQRELFSRVPGILVSEQQTPSQLNINYRGIGNPQESEYMLILQDGVPIASDWIGFPTTYYLPFPQGLERMEFVRGGAGLMYGPEPAGAINLVSRRPDKENAARLDQIVGSNSLRSTWAEANLVDGDLTVHANAGFRSADGQRQNGDYRVAEGDLILEKRLAAGQTLGLDLRTYRSANGDPGRMSYAQFDADPRATVTPYNHHWVERAATVLRYDGDLSNALTVSARLWHSFQTQTTRSVVGGSATTMDRQTFWNDGLDARARFKIDSRNTWTLGLLAYRSISPWTQVNSLNPAAGEDNFAGTSRLAQQRSSRYESLFSDWLYRVGSWHFVPSVRLDDQRLSIDESVRPSTLTRPLIKLAEQRHIPLFGFGFGNDFGSDHGHGNETYFNVSQGFRPVRYLDVASPFSNLNPTLNNPDPTRSVTYEAGVHGWPREGLYYDVSIFQINVRNRIETRVLSPTDSINVNTGDTRHRGIELQADDDIAALGAWKLKAFGSVSLLDATFTASAITGQIGKTPAFAPRWLARLGVTATGQGLRTSLSAQTISSEYWQDSNLASATLPAKIPGHTVFDLAGDWQLNARSTLLFGVANLTDKKYYDRVFQNGIEPGAGRTFYAGLQLKY